jgi:microtubule-associated protein-like 1/2
VHNGPVFAICVLKDGSVVTGGGKDGKLIHFDGNYKKSDLEAEVKKILKMFLSILNEY